MGKAKKAKLKKHGSHPYKKSATGLGKQQAKQSNPATGSDKPQSRKQVHKVDLTPPLDPDDKILLVGEGDFSFSHALLDHYACTDLTATTFESPEVLVEKYPQAKEYVSTLEENGHTVLYNIDATKLGHAHTPGAAFIRKTRFDTIIFNFPHIGGKSTNVNRQVRANQELVVKFLENAKGLLAKGGKILLTVFEGEPYDLWGVRNLARHVGLRVERSLKFVADMYPGYKHARTLGNIEGGGGWKGEERNSRVFVFMKEDEEAQKPAPKKNRKDSDEDEDSD